MINKPLVSVLIITYNSSQYIIEALESVKSQTYDNIELIVSDDASTDNTVILCKNWIDNNGSRFRRTQIVETDKNSGIPANCNRGIKVCHGDWIKLFAGDDVLLDSCISTFVSSISQEKDIIIGLIQPFSIDKEGLEHLYKIEPKDIKRYFFNKEAKFQFKYLLNNSFNFAPSAFIRRQLYKDLDYYDEEYRVFEDLPFWLKATERGVKIHLVNSPVVKYRTAHESAVFSQKNFYNTRFRECLYLFHFNYIHKHVKWYNLIYYESFYIDYITYLIITKWCANKRNRLSHIISGSFNRLKFSRYYYYIIDNINSKIK